MSIEKKLQSMGVEIPKAPAPVACYIPGLVCGKQLVTSGQLPSKEGTLAKGRVGENMDLDSAYEAAKQSAINCLAVAKQVLGSLDKIERVVKIVVYVNSSPDFEGQSKVANGASDFIGEVFGAQGVHVRSAVGVAALPLGACCEIEMTFEVKA